MLKVGHPNYIIENKGFNDRVTLFIEKIFQTEECGPIGYIAPRRYLPHAALTTMPDRHRDVVERAVATAETLKRYSIADLGEYERVIFGALASGHGSTYVLVGEMGSGKTATMTFMRDVLSRKPQQKCHEACRICDPEVVFVSLDAGTQYTSKLGNPIAAFRDDLIHSLHNRIRALFVGETLTDRFIAFAKTAREQRYQRFGDFHTELSMWQLEHAQSFSGLDEELKCDFLLNWIRKAGSPELRLDLLGALGAFVKNEIRRSATCFIIMIDNIDRHIEPSQQMAILLLLFGLQETGIRVLIAMRQTSFAGLGSIAAFSFQYIPHIGPRPLMVGLARVRHYLASESDGIADSALSESDKMYLRARMEETAALLGNDAYPRGRLNALSGSSVRAGLTLLNRLIINGAIPFDSAAPAHKLDWFRAALLGTGEHQQFDPDDRYVANIFAGATHGKFSWVAARILQLTEALFRPATGRNVKNICALLTMMLDRDVEEELVESTNYLLQPTRPLLWVDGAYGYKSYDDMLARNDVLSLTRAGHLYWKHLMVEPVYLQESLFSAAWSDPHVPVEVNFRSAVARSQGARAIADIMQRQDFPQHRRLLDAVARTEHLASIRALTPLSVIITSRLAVGAAESMKNAVSTVSSAFDVQQEGEAWLEVLSKAQREMEGMLLTAPSVLVRAVRAVESAVALASGLMRHVHVPDGK